MAFTFGFYNSINHDRRYDAVQVGQIFDGIIKDGVYETYKKAMMVRVSNNDNEVIVQPGRAWFNHTWSYNDSDLPLSMPTPDVFYDRIDAVVLDINSSNASRRNAIIVVKGEDSPYPARPTLINTTEHHQYPLAYIRRYGGRNSIYQEDITNTVGTSECPFVIGVLEGLDVDEFLAQWSAEFNHWNADKKTAFEYWFKHLHYELDSDVAGHLQEQIDRFAYIYVSGKTLFLPMSGASVVDQKLIFRMSNA